MSQLEHLKLPEEWIDLFYERQNMKQFKLSDMREDFVKFCKFMVGFPVGDYQAYMADELINNKKTVIVKGRQIGFSTFICLFCLWFGWFKKAQTGAMKNTKIIIVSKDDPAAKDLLQMIKDFIYKGDRHMSAFLTGRKEHSTELFSREIEQSTADILKFKNGTEIRSYPPTGKVRGKSADILFIDEFAFLGHPDPEKFYYEDCLPTVSETGGKIILSSTPNGYGDFFHQIVDPDNKLEKHEFARYSVPFTVNNKSENYVRMVEEIRAHADERKFAQEFMCSFESSDVNFFVPKKVKEMFDDSVLQIDVDRYEYIGAVDYGQTAARTVVTLCTLIDGVIYRIYYKEFESGYDLNNLPGFLTGLRDRFKINKLVVDDCPMGFQCNQLLQQQGWNIELFDFHTKKVEAYCSFRGYINSGKIKCAPDKETEKQFLEMQEEEGLTGKLKIHKPRSGRDDIVDSFVMAAYPFLQIESRIGAYLV